jgi:hypothetical protein
MTSKTRTRKRTRTRTRTRTRKTKVMYGCSHKRTERRPIGGSNGPIPPLSWKEMNAAQRGGSCTMCGAGQSGGGCGCNNPQNGGSTSPGPFVGSAWGSAQWPGTNGVSGDRNYLAFNNQNGYRIPAMSRDDSGLKMNGGKRQKGIKGVKKRKSLMRGGAVMQDFSSLIGNLSFNTKSVSNAIHGYPAPVNPNPYMAQYNQGSRFQAYGNN